VNLLLQQGADVHAKDKGGLVPLHNACSYGHYEVVQVVFCMLCYCNSCEGHYKLNFYCIIWAILSLLTVVHFLHRPPNVNLAYIKQRHRSRSAGQNTIQRLQCQYETLLPQTKNEFIFPATPWNDHWLKLRSSHFNLIKLITQNWYKSTSQNWLTLFADSLYCTVYWTIVWVMHIVWNVTQVLMTFHYFTSIMFISLINFYISKSSLTMLHKLYFHIRCQQITKLWHGKVFLA